MVDLSKHHSRARKAIDGRNYDLAIEICTECQEVDPTSLKTYELLIEAAQRRAQEGGKKGMSFGLKMSRDPHKLLSAAIKAVAKSPDLKNFTAAGDAARAVMDTGVKKRADVAILLYEEARGTGMFNGQMLWNLAHAYYAKFELTKAKDAIDNAIARMNELNKNDKSHKEAGRTLKNWEAKRSMEARNDKKAGGGDDYRSQMADDDDARKNEVMGRQIRTVEDADEVLKYVDADLAENDQNKGLWMKRADVQRRVQRWDEARQSLEKARALDEHDFSIVMRIGEIGMQEIKTEILALEKAGKDSSAAKTKLLHFEIDNYRDWVKRQPTELRHKFELGRRLFTIGEIDESAQLFQKSLNDPQNKSQAHKYLGHCFAKKKLFDMAVDQFAKCLEMIVDKNGKEAMDVLYNKARLLEKLKKRDLAIADYTSLVERDLGFKDAATRLADLKSQDD